MSGYCARVLHLKRKSSTKKQRLRLSRADGIKTRSRCIHTLNTNTTLGGLRSCEGAKLKPFEETEIEDAPAEATAGEVPLDEQVD